VPTVGAGALPRAQMFASLEENVAELVAHLHRPSPHSGFSARAYSRTAGRGTAIRSTATRSTAVCRRPRSPSTRFVPPS
jgi:hypothetical protein